MIRNLGKFVAGLPNWDCLKGCFGSAQNTAPMDVDGFYERNGFSLFLEWKGPDGALTEGQRRAFATLISYRKVTVIVIWGNAAESTVERLLIWDYNGKEMIRDADLELFRATVSRWKQRADRGGKGNTPS